MKKLLTACLLGLALVVSGCGGTGDSLPASTTDPTGATSDDEALGLSLRDPRIGGVNAYLCQRLRERNRQSWWTLGDFVGQPFVDACMKLYGAKVVGDCLLEARGSCPGANLRGADLRGLRLSEMNLSGADLTGANVSNAHLTFAKLDGANLTRTNFSNAQMYGVNLRGATIEGTNFGGADLHDVIWVDGRTCARSSPRGQCS